MRTVRSIQGTLNAPLYRAIASTQRPCLAKLTPRVSSRVQSSAAAAKPRAPPTRERGIYVKHKFDNLQWDKNETNIAARKRFGKLNTPAGKQWLVIMNVIDKNLDKLTAEFVTISAKREKLIRLLRTETYHVQTYQIEAPPAPTLHIHIDRGRLIVDSKRIPNIWLRDNCQCSSCMHESTKQRLLDTFSIPKNLYMVKHDLGQELKAKGLTIEWSDGHKSTYSLDFLTRAAQAVDMKAVTRQAMTKPTLWGASIASSPPSVPHDLTNLSTLLTNLRTHGFCYVDGVAHPDPSATEALLKSISFIRETHYGGFYDFTADLASQDTAYTNIALEAHTDTTYFSDPAGLQAFHLLSHTDGEGGASLLVDGFKVAQELYETDRNAYKILSSVNVHAHASGNEGISIQPYRGFPVLEHDPATGILLRVRWNSSDRASIGLPINEVEMWYDAARKFDALLKKKENEYWQQLTPGRVLIFDNWRVLHGRSAFTGTRRICGGYINRDDWISKFKMEAYGKDEVLGSLASG